MKSYNLEEFQSFLINCDMNYYLKNMTIRNLLGKLCNESIYFSIRIKHAPFISAFLKQEIYEVLQFTRI